MQQPHQKCQLFAWGDNLVGDTIGHQTRT